MVARLARPAEKGLGQPGREPAGGRGGPVEAEAPDPAATSRRWARPHRPWGLRCGRLDRTGAGVARPTGAPGAARSSRRGTLRVSVPPDAGRILTAVLLSFLAAHPHVQLEVEGAARHVDLVAEGFDVAIRGGPIEDESLVVRRILTTRVGLFASRAYLDAHGTPTALEELAGHACILLPRPHPPPPPGPRLRRPRGRRAPGPRPLPGTAPRRRPGRTPRPPLTRFGR